MKNLKNRMAEFILVGVFIFACCFIVLLATDSDNTNAWILLVTIPFAAIILFGVLSVIDDYVTRQKEKKRFLKKPKKSAKKWLRRDKWDGTIRNAKLTVFLQMTPQQRINLQKAINEILEVQKLGKVIGGKSFYKERMEIDHSEIYLSLRHDNYRFAQWFAERLTGSFNLPRNTLLECAGTVIRVGKMGGLACYLDVTEYNTEDDVEKYKAMTEEIRTSLGNMGACFGFWEASNDVNYERDEEGLKEYRKNNPHVIALYYYGADYRELKDVIEPILEKSIFSEVYRIVQQC